MHIKNIILTSLIVITATVSYATDTRDIGEQEGEFVVELRQRSVEDMAESTDKTQKYILIVGQNKDLTKDDLIAIKDCVLEVPATEKNKLLQMFDAEGSTVSALADNLQALACQNFTAEREKKDQVASVTTPNFTGLNDFISEHMFKCIADQVDKSNWTKVEDRGFKIPNSYSLETIKRYCPKGS